jgi:hypothetical protein
MLNTRTAAAIMRRIATRRPSPAPASLPRPRTIAPTMPYRPVRAFVCGPCEVSWGGAEADCWNCGRPATTALPDRASALQQLLQTTSPASLPKAAA